MSAVSDTLPLSTQMSAILYEKALEVGLISQKNLDVYEECLAYALSYHSSTHALDDIAHIRARMAELAPLDRLEISHLIAVETVVQSAVQNYENARSTEMKPPQERFEDLFKALFQNRPEGAMDRLLKARTELLISLVHTMHPVVYHTADSRKLESSLSQLFEEKVEYGYTEKGLKSDSLQMLGNNVLRSFLSAIARGKVTITPHRQVTAIEENAMEKENIERIQEHIKSLCLAWNAAVEHFFSQLDVCDDKKIALLKLGLSDLEKVFEIRTWGCGADADGRERSNAIQLAQAIYTHTNPQTGAYEGPILDFRQNAEIHNTLVCALVQKKFQESRGREYIESTDGHHFERFCETFIEHVNSEHFADSWKNPKRSTYQELHTAQASFCRALILSDFTLLPEGLREQVLAFTKMYPPLFETFLKEHDLPCDTTFDDLKNYDDKRKFPDSPFPNLMRKWRQRVKDQPLDVEGESAPIHFLLSEDGLHVQPDNYTRTREYLDRCRKMKEGQLTELERVERGILLDVIKRMFVINEAITQADARDPLSGAKIANRHQIANFGKKEHFYEIMLLFKESGLISIDTKRQTVSEVKMGIQPLLETLEDLQHAPDLFEELLKDPLVLSYYKTRGVGEFMLGYSDGSKSAGNFASRWQAYETARHLETLFSSYNIQTRFFDGFGRGYDRGGSAELGIAPLCRPDSVNRSGYYDATLQGDLPMDMAISPFYGKSQLASIVIGVLVAREQATTRTEIDHAKRDKLEEGIRFIAKKSAEVFQERVRYNLDAMDFIQGMPNNPLKSSRKSKRGATVKADYEAIRAIANEYAANFADLPYHNTGLKEAFEAFVKSGIEIPDETGTLVQGNAALRALLQHPFFETTLRIIEVGLTNFDPTIAGLYAEKIDEKSKNSRAGSYVRTQVNSLKGLHTRLRALLDHGKDPHFPNPHKEFQAMRLDALDVMAHGLLLAMGDFHPQKPHEKATVYNALFSNAAEISHRRRPKAFLTIPNYAFSSK